MTVHKGSIYISQGVGFPIELVQVGEHLYEVDNIDALMEAHYKTCRTFNNQTYPNFVNGVFQRAFYQGDSDSHTCKWFQAILLGKPNAHILTEVRRWGTYVEFLYDDGFANVFIQMENTTP